MFDESIACLLGKWCVTGAPGQQIKSIEDWRQVAFPKGPKQWAEGRSACELARAWCGSGRPAIPQDVRQLLDSRAEIPEISIERISPECQIRFDDLGGEPRNEDLAFIGKSSAYTVAGTIEAKSDEPFGETISNTLANAPERRLENPRSGGWCE